MPKKPHPYDQVVYLLQGGGALGAYQVGVCEALLESGCEPDWVVGTSIGAINSAIIAGNTPEKRIEKLNQFWNRAATPFPEMPVLEDNYLLRQVQKFWSSQWTLMFGVPGFFKPRILNPWLNFSNHPDQISFYDTRELRHTLEELVDFNLINSKKVRLTLASVCVENGQLVYFDNTKQVIGPEHVMASGALPPGFPAIRIEGKNYWDGGIISNTPLHAVVSDKSKANLKLLCIMVHLFSYDQRTPISLMEILKRKKDMEFSSRFHQILQALCKNHDLNHIIDQLVDKYAKFDSVENIKKLTKNASRKTINITRFHYRDDPSNLWSKDYEFSSQTLKEHRQTGYGDVKRALQDPCWLQAMPDDEGVVLHEF
ncbi:MAG: hypothetical protein A3E83_08775 [Gammaproteobacteria bacterium RIFCSPHIGHO2_12_FULL_41_20]|nr:MAG: hypothetical protein A3E83_08775 [Gammaproteobacteria bacterium RIFCSPHIGHO2_12_FULL_41_20]